MDYFGRNNADMSSMEVDDQAKLTFLEMARWTQFLAIIGFIFLGLMVLGGIGMGLVLSNTSGYSNQLGVLAGIGGIGIMMLYVLMAAVMFYPTYALLKYSTCIKAAMHQNDKQKFNEAIVHLKNVFRFYGIITIICLAIYGLMILFIALGAMSK
jgi:hypothetical protein